MAHPSSNSNNGISLLEVDESPDNLLTTQMILPTQTVFEHNDSYKHKLQYFLFKNPFIPPSPPDYKIPLRQIHSIASKLLAIYSTITPLSKDTILTLFDYLWTNHFTSPFTKNFPTSNTHPSLPKTYAPANPTYRFGSPSVYARLVKTISASETTQSPLTTTDIINLHQEICSSITNSLAQTAEISSRPSSRQGRSLSRRPSYSSISSRSPSPSPSFTTGSTHTSNLPLPYQLQTSFQTSFIVITSAPLTSSSPHSVSQAIRDKDWDSQTVTLVWSSEIKSLVSKLSGDGRELASGVGCLTNEELEEGVVTDAEKQGNGTWMCKSMTLKNALEFVVDLASITGFNNATEEDGKEDGTFYEED